MSSRRWQWAVIAGAVALASGELVGRPGPAPERETMTSRALLAETQAVAARGAEEPRVTRGEVVKESLSARPRLDYFLFVPKRVSSDALLVAVHGISREAREQAEGFAPLAAKHGFSVVAPHFDERVYDDYQRLGRRGRGARADVALDRLLDELERQGVASGRVYLFGYSGGGQFVHRYVMAHPERVAGGIAAASGWYTFPDLSAEYPYGIRVGAELPGVRLRPSAFLSVPMLAVVGAEDRERDENLRRSRALDRHQGRNRVERAQRWVRAMREAAKERELQPRVELKLLEGSGHSFEESMRAGLGKLVADTLIRWRGALEESRDAGRAPELAAPGSRWCVADGR